MKKRFFRAFSVVLLAALLFSGCHGARETDAFAVPGSQDTETKYEITFWAKNDTNKNQTLIYERAIREFEALYPNITVTLRLYTDYAKIYNDVITNISTGTTPNVCITYPDHIATYLTGDNVVVTLDALMDDSRYGLGGSEVRFESLAREEIIGKYLEEGVFSGHCYAVPFMRSTEACYVNRTMVEALGYELPEVLTWDFIWEVSEAAAATKGTDGVFAANGQTVLLPFIYKSTDNMMIQLLRQSGAGYSTENGDILLFNDTTRSLLLDIADHVEKGAFSTFKISGYPANFLNAGQCIFAVDSTAGSTWMGSEAPLLDISPDKLVKFETAVYPVPQLDPEHPQMISQGPSICVFNKEDPQEVLASWLFTQYLLSNSVQIAYAETEGYVPVTTLARESAEYQDYLARAGEDSEHYSVKLAATKLLLNNTDNTFVTPVYNGSASLRDASAALIENVTKSVRRRQTVDDSTLDTLFADVSALYRLDQVDASTPRSAEDLGPLPKTAVALLVSLGVAWVGIGAYALTDFLKRRKKH